MQVILDIFLFAGCWAAGLIIFSVILQNLKDYKSDHELRRLLTVFGLIAAAVATLVLAAMLNGLGGCGFMAGGYAVAFFSVIDPIKLTQAKADEIGRQAAREAALKEQKEEQKRMDEKIAAENARIYAEEKKKNSKK